MIDLSTKYLGLTLKNPVMAASSGLTADIESIKKLESNGAAAIVLKSLFEEEILQQEIMKKHEAEENKMIYSELSETLDYIDMHIKEDTINKYLDLIRLAKKETLIPIIASINCTTDYEWTEFASRIEQAGADALELNIFFNPADLSDKNLEKTCQDICNKVLSVTKIPVSIKISPFFTKLAKVINDLSSLGVKGVVLFNRFYSPDIDLEKMEIIPASYYSSETEYLSSLRWIGLMSKKVNCDMAASTGIHTAEAIIKQIVAGAAAVQVASVLYEKGIDYLSTLVSDLEKWMEDHHYTHLSQLKGKLSQESIDDPAAYERLQFMKHYSGIK
jgi:dihydroorotate dehydrogenase (fumarate)